MKLVHAAITPPLTGEGTGAILFYFADCSIIPKLRERLGD